MIILESVRKKGNKRSIPWCRMNWTNNHSHPEGDLELPHPVYQGTHRKRARVCSRSRDTPHLSWPHGKKDSRPDYLAVQLQHGAAQAGRHHAARCRGAAVHPGGCRCLDARQRKVTQGRRGTDLPGDGWFRPYLQLHRHRELHARYPAQPEGYARVSRAESRDDQGTGIAASCSVPARQRE